MGSSQWFVRELRSSDTPDQLHGRALTDLTPVLARAHYELVARNAGMLRYERRHLPRSALTLGVLLIVGAAYAAVSFPPAHGVLLVPTGALGLGGIALLASVRRSDLLTVTVTARTGGSEARLAGCLNDRARIAVRTWDPPVRPNLRCITHQTRLSPRAARPSAR